MTFKQLAEARFSARKYTGEAVSADDLGYIMECVRLAPSATNRQPWRFLIVKSADARARLQRCYDRPWFATAPLYIIALKQKGGAWVRNADGKDHGDVDLGIAVEHLCLAAADRGLGTCWVCNFNPQLLAELFPTPGYEAVAIVPLGHIAPDCPHAAKSRKELSEIAEEI